MCPKHLGKLTLILIITIFSTSLFAQVDSTKTNKGVNINFFNGYALSYKWNTTQDMSYRIYLSLNSSWTDGESDYENKHIHNGKETSSNSHDGNDNQIHVSTDLSFQFLFNVYSGKSLNFYFGVGPNINYYYRKWASESFYSQNEEFENKTTSINKSYGVGIISLAGIEANLTDNITLFAETHLIGEKNWSTNENIREDSNSNSEKSVQLRNGSSWSANLQLVKVGLGIYF